MKKIKVLVVFGTRPEAIKMCPLVKELKRRDSIDVKVCVTGQHKEMLQQVMDCFKVKPDYNLEIMQNKQTLFDITSNIILKIKPVLEVEKPNIVLVHGDTTTTFVTALCSYYLQIPVGHVEAGLRTYNIYSPYPEEFNRQATGIIAALNFSPTELAKNNLIREGKDPKSIFVTGNTVIDALKTTIKEDYKNEIFDWIGTDKMILLTAHRRENLGKTLERMFNAIKRILLEYENVKVIYPIHKNPVVRETANKVFGDMNKIKLIEPLEVIDFHNFMNKAYMILTDSGGIQEEAPSLGKPVLVMRDTTERPEGVKAGTLKLVGTEEKRIYNNIKLLLDNKSEYEKMSQASNPYGDGNSCKRIVDIILQKLL